MQTSLDDRRRDFQRCLRSEEGEKLMDELERAFLKPNLKGATDADTNYNVGAAEVVKLLQFYRDTDLNTEEIPDVG